MELNWIELTKIYSFPKNVYLLQVMEDVIQRYSLKQHPRWPRCTMPVPYKQHSIKEAHESKICCWTMDHIALRPQKWGGLLGPDRGGRGRKREGSTADTARKRPERPWTAAITMEVLRRCPLTIAQQLVYYAIAVSTAVHCPLHCCWGTTRSERSPTFSGLTWGSSSTSLLLISPGPCEERAHG